MQAEQAAGVFAALGDPTRIRIVEQLAQGVPLSATALTDGTMTRQAIMRHLAVLHDVGLISRERHGREVCYQLHDARVGEAQRYLDRISSAWDQAIARLKAHVETE
jgi:DNA-binding transcriptional ArsR family regulator